MKRLLPFIVLTVCLSVGATAANDTAVFAEPGFGYAIHYPVGWKIAYPAKFTVVFGGAPDTAAYYTTVSIDNRLSPRPGEPARGAAAVLKQYVEELGTKAKGSKIETQSPFFYRQNGVALDGRQAVTEFDGKTERMRQWVVVVPRRSGTVVHVWMFSAPSAEFERALPTARGMLDSWQINGSDSQ